MLQRQSTFNEPPGADEQAHMLTVRTDAPLDLAALAAAWSGMGVA